MARRFRTDRLVLLAVGIFLGAALAVYYILQHVQGLNLQAETDRVLLVVLAVVLGLLAISLLFVLLRNLIKLIVERRRNVLGSRFRTKLVFIFLGLVLIPSFVLFYAAISLIRQVNESLFSDPLEQITDSSHAIVAQYNRNLRDDCARFCTRIALEIGERRLLDTDRSAELAARAQTWLVEDGLDYVVLYASSGDRPVFARVGLSSGRRRGVNDDELTSASAELVRGARAGGASSNWLDRVGPGQRASAIAPILSGASRETIGAVMVGRYIPPETAQRSERINKAFNDYKKASRERSDLKRVTILLFATLAVLVLFAATWTGLYLARQITVPIQALAEGTRAISAGNLDYRVEMTAGDEIGYLIESFNSMTDELRSSRAAIEMSRRQLEERRQYIEQLLENVPAGVISLDETGIVTTMNRAAYRILGLDPERKCTGLFPAEVFTGPDLFLLVQEIEDLRTGEVLSQVREFLVRLDGRPVNLAASLSARRDAQGAFIGALIVIEDLTPVIRAQKTAAWREVARRLAHEIKNPLTPIQLSAERVLKKFNEGAEDFPRILTEGAQTIVDEVKTLQRLVDEFSRFARMPAVSPVPTDPNVVVEAALSLYDGLQPGIALERDLDPAAPRIPLDAEQMKRALINLIDNAIAALDGAGSVTLTTRSIPAERLLRIEVADDGPGISSDDKERLFVPYFSTKKKGTGLGLAIVNRIVSDHSGFIRVEDNRPRGARFVIDLPA